MVAHLDREKLHKLTIDDERSMLWFTRRHPTSRWAAPNKARIQLLEQQGPLLPAGRRMVRIAQVAAKPAGGERANQSQPRTKK